MPPQEQEKATATGTVAPSTDPAIRLIDVHKSYGRVRAVDGVSLDIRPGEFFTMLGPSGSGKTTLLRLIAGFEAADSGAIQLQGNDVTRIPPYDRDVNTVFQDYALFPHMSVRQNVEYGLRVKGIGRRARRDRAQEALATVGLADYGKRKPDQLSGGQRQRVALARAIVNRPAVLLLDEPLGALDLKLRQGMQIELKRIQREAAITFVFVTHDQDEALTMSDRIAVFNDGQVQQVGSPVEIYESPASEYVAGFIGISNILEQGGTRYSVRPERIRLLTDSDPAPAGAEVQPATISEVLYLGMVTRIQAITPDERIISVVRQNATATTTASPLRLGSPVRLAWWPEHSHQLDVDDPPARRPGKDSE